MKQYCLLAFVSFFVLWVGMGCVPSKAPKERYVVVLSMDGFRSEYPSRAHTPTLDSLASVGVRSVFRPCFPSVTFPNHYSMATGLHPDHHGLVSNSFYDMKLDSVYRMGNLDPRFFGGEPIWNTAERQGIRTAPFYWVGSEVPLTGGQPSIWKTFDKSVSFSSRADSVIAWLRLPEAIRPHLIMWYMEEPRCDRSFRHPGFIGNLGGGGELRQCIGVFFLESPTAGDFR